MVVATGRAGDGAVERGRHLRRVDAVEQRRHARHGDAELRDVAGTAERVDGRVEQVDRLSRDRVDELEQRGIARDEPFEEV